MSSPPSRESAAQALDACDRAIDALFPALHGWCDPAKGKAMARLVVQRGITRLDRHELGIVELGVFGGRSLIAMGLAVKHVLKGAGRVDGIDPYTAAAALEGTNERANQEWWAKVDYPTILKSARDGITRAGLVDVVTITQQRSQDVVTVYRDGSLDVLHVDANHSEESSCHDVETWVPKMRRDGFIVFDDINWPSTARAQRLLLEKGCTLSASHGTWAIYTAP